MAGERQLQWGILGTGAVANCFVADLRMSDSGKAAAVGSRRQETADRFADSYDIPRRHASYDALVEDPEVDVVYVATPGPFHLENAVQALEAGKPVLVEKSFTTNAIEARELVDKARSLGLFVMEAMWTRFLPHVIEIRSLVAEGALGEIVTIIADHGHWFPHEDRRFDPDLGGGALLDLGVYPLSFSSMLLGTPNRVVAMIEPAFTGVDGETSLLLGHSGGAHAVITCGMSAESRVEMSIVGTEGRIDVDGPAWGSSSFTLRPRQGAPVRLGPAGGPCALPVRRSHDRDAPRG